MIYQGKTLKVRHFGNIPEDSKWVTINSMNIKLVEADVTPTMRENTLVKKAVVVFLEGDSVELYLSEYDLNVLEYVVGFYDLDPIGV
jgi:hypothetical protein